MRSQERILQVGTDVSVGETIVTGPAGQVQIVFDDNTRLVVGPGSALLVETYLLASSNTAEKLTVNALGGTFRFITGNSPKPLIPSKLRLLLLRCEAQNSTSSWIVAAPECCSIRALCRSAMARVNALFWRIVATSASLRRSRLRLSRRATPSVRR